MRVKYGLYMCNLYIVRWTWFRYECILHRTASACNTILICLNVPWLFKIKRWETRNYTPHSSWSSRFSSDQSYFVSGKHCETVNNKNLVNRMENVLWLLKLIFNIIFVWKKKISLFTNKIRFTEFNYRLICIPAYLHTTITNHGKW